MTHLLCNACTPTSTTWSLLPDMTRSNPYYPDLPHSYVPSTLQPPETRLPSDHRPVTQVDVQSHSLLSFWQRKWVRRRITTREVHLTTR